MTTMTANHRKERTAKLHTAFNTMDRKAALAYATSELGYTAAGASSWFSWWTPKGSKPAKTKAVKAAPVVVEPIVAEPVAPVADTRKPWEVLGVSKSTYYKRRAKGTL